MHGSEARSTHVMRQHNDTTNDAVRQVTLPSGRTIEIVYLDEPPAPAVPQVAGAATPSHAEAAVDLTICGACDCQFVQPVDWEEAGPRHWQLELRCPNCEARGTGRRRGRGRRPLRPGARARQRGARTLAPRGRRVVHRGRGRAPARRARAGPDPAGRLLARTARRRCRRRARAPALARRPARRVEVAPWPRRRARARARAPRRARRSRRCGRRAPRPARAS